MSNFRMQDRMELKALVDYYATESDKNNQDCYVEIFRPDIKLKVYFNGKLGMTANDVQDMIRQYKAFGAAKVSFHMNGQQSLDFQDDTHATGTCYALASLVNEENGKDKLTVHAVRYQDKYVKIDNRWWIAERDQFFEWSTFPPLSA
ncbi:bile acid 7-alpha-dehydratase [Neocallimastix lanati (nom. inval.)]|uniref:Bile acid 7-alpha-dehydratase n=1 Tax=Neocallimastix californiae TaxID=1754190 RepID=A0A1Y1YTF9_9FUNG|nr:bile acid 7-alpha-dehydratase [Neocallimastix sp. JGI-2020a]ORY01256.1 bile acid 7-alpha-dehydratase [Neocallimastix californiae]|eukprot:ORY01256.1 bile acid 7-alpha-dehydratase [Neocallimastix californiae]